MDRCALFVDAGYALADGALAVHGTRNRDSVSWDYAGLLKLFGGLARERTALPLLRCYWYDTSADGRRADEHDALADIPGVKLRLTKNRPNRKEGVEAEIRKDLTALARNHAISDVIIVSSEEDLAPVIADVQDLGIRVTLLLIASADGSWAASRTLRQECDDVLEISSGHLRPYVDLIAGAEPQLAAAGYRELAGASQGSGSQPAIEAPAQRLYASPVAAEHEPAVLAGLSARGADQREQARSQDAARFAPVSASTPSAGGPVAPDAGQRVADAQVHSSGPVAPIASGQPYQQPDASVAAGSAAPDAAAPRFGTGGFAGQDTPRGDSQAPGGFAPRVVESNGQGSSPATGSAALAGAVQAAVPAQAAVPGQAAGPVQPPASGQPGVAGQPAPAAQSAPAGQPASTTLPAAPAQSGLQGGLAAEAAATGASQQAPARGQASPADAGHAGVQAASQASPGQPGGLAGAGALASSAGARNGPPAGPAPAGGTSGGMPEPRAVSASGGGQAANGQGNGGQFAGQQSGGLPDGTQFGGQPNGTEFGRPQNGAQQYGIPQNGAQQYGVQPNSAQQYSDQPNGTQYGTPQNGAPQYENPLNGAPQNGAPQNGAQQYGSQPNGAQYGSPQNGTHYGDQQFATPQAPAGGQANGLPGGRQPGDSTAGLGTAGPGTAGPGTAGPGAAGPGAAGPGTAGPGTAGLGTGGNGLPGGGTGQPASRQPASGQEPASLPGTPAHQAGAAADGPGTGRSQPSQNGFPYGPPVGHDSIGLPGVPQNGAQQPGAAQLAAPSQGRLPSQGLPRPVQQDPLGGTTQQGPGHQVPGLPGRNLPGQGLPGQELPGQELPGQSLPGTGQHRPDATVSQPTALPPAALAPSDPQRSQPQRQLPPPGGVQYLPDRSAPYGGQGHPAPYSGGGSMTYPPYVSPPPVPSQALSVGDAVQSAHAEGFGFGEAVARDAPALWLEAVLARKPRMPSDLEARLLQGSALPIDSLLHDEVRHALRRGFWDALERSRH